MGVALAAYVALMVGVRVNPPTTPPAPDTAPNGPARAAPRGAIDYPRDGSTLTYTSIDVRGWALDQVVEQGTGVDRVSIFVDDTLVSQADYGMPRDDISNQFGAQFEVAGWSAHLDLHALAIGKHRLEARAHSVFSDHETAYAASIVIAPPPSMPRGSIDTPNSGSPVSGTTQVEGWALDQASTAGAGVDRVQLYLDDTLVADATYGIPRPDIGAAYGADFEKSGWVAGVDFSGRSGVHQLEARVHSSYDDRETSYTVPVVVTP